MSVFELVGELCLQIFDAEFAKEPWNPNLPKIRRKTLRKLRSKCFEILLHKDSIPAVEGGFCAGWPAAAQVAGRVLHLRASGRWRDAERVYGCALRLLGAQMHEDTAVEGTLELLLRLQGDPSACPQAHQEPVLWGPDARSAWTHKETQDGDGKLLPYPIPLPGAFDPPAWMACLLPIGPNPYFPAEGFPFDRPPGQGLRVASRFLRSSTNVPQYTITEIPPLTEPRGLTIPKLLHEPPRGDEGYCTSEGSRVASPAAELPEEVDDDIIWQKALDYQPCRLRTWESLGSRVPQPEKPYVSEAGKEAASHFLLLAEGFSPGPWRTITLEELNRDLGFLLLGAHSHTFPFNEDSMSLYMAPNVRVNEFSYAALTSLCDDFLEMGTCVRRLHLLTERGVPSHPRTSLMEALREFVCTYLQFHWGVALVLGAGAPAPPPCRTQAEMMEAMAHSSSLVALREHSEPLRQRCLALARLLGVAPPPLSLDPLPIPAHSLRNSYCGPFVLPLKAGPLLSHLCDALMQETRPDLCCIFFSALRAVTAAYFRLVERWLFEGVLADPWEEFFVAAWGESTGGWNMGTGERGRKDWAHGFRVVPEAVPSFMQGLYLDVLACGKTVNLLRLCCPKAALCVALQSGHPGVPCCLRGCELRALSAACQQFEARVRMLDGRGEGAPPWRPCVHPSPEAAVETAVAAHQARERHLLKAKLEQEAGRRAAVQQRQQWLHELQEQAKQVQARREEEAQRTLEEEQRAAHILQLKMQREDEMKAQERQRIIEYYEELSETAAKRQQLADWRARRWALAESREDLVLKERAAARLLMAKAALGDQRTVVEEQKNSRNMELGLTSLLEEDTCTAVATAAASPESLGAATSTGTSPPANAAAIGEYDASANIQLILDNATANDKESPNNNTVNYINNMNAVERTQTNGDINENLLHTLNTSVDAHTERNLLDTTIEDVELGNILLPRQQQGILPTVDNAVDSIHKNTLITAAEIKAKVNTQEFGWWKPEAEPLNRQALKEHRLLSAAEKNRQKVMEQEFGISARIERPKTVPLRNNTQPQDLVSKAQAEAEKDFEENTAQRHANRWHMMQGNAIFTMENTSGTPSIKGDVQNDGKTEAEKDFEEITAQRHANRFHMMQGNAVFTMEKTSDPTEPSTKGEAHTDGKEPSGEGEVNVTVAEKQSKVLVSPTAESEETGGQEQERTYEPMVTQETPSEAEGPTIRMEDGGLSVSRIPKSLSSGSVGVWKGPSGQSSKASSSYNLCSLASSASFDFSSGRCSLSSPSTDRDGLSLNVYKGEDSSAGGAKTSGATATRGLAFWKSSRLAPPAHGLSPDAPDVADVARSTPGETEELREDLDCVDFTDFSSILVALQKSVAIPLYTQLRLANVTLLRYFFEELHVLSHLEALRAFFLLSDGEFAQVLTDTLFSKMATVQSPSMLLNHVTLNVLLRKALDAAAPRPFDDPAQRLSFKVTSNPEHFFLLSTDVVSCVRLRYKAEWPLNLVLTEEALHKYDSIFSFLLRLRLVAWRLHSAFLSLKWNNKGRGEMPLLHQVHVWRHEMTQFARAVQAYVSAAALSEPWVPFREALARASTLDQLYHEHVAYVKKTLYRCLLYKNCRYLHSLLLAALDAILKFLAQLEASSWRPREKCAGGKSSEDPEFTKLRELHRKFRQAVCQLVRLVWKLVQAGFQVHLQGLLESLCTNGFYDTSSSHVVTASAVTPTAPLE